MTESQIKKMYAQINPNDLNKQNMKNDVSKTLNKSNTSEYKKYNQNSKPIFFDHSKKL
jgi:hypothetical protein